MDQENLKHLAELCRIEIDDMQAESLAKDLEKILHYVDQLTEVDTEGVEPCHIVHEAFTSSMREDETDQTLDREEFLNNSPSHIGGMIRVPPVIHA